MNIATLCLEQIFRFLVIFALHDSFSTLVNNKMLHVLLFSAIGHNTLDGFETFRIILAPDHLLLF